jgi:hypothetical protein
LYAIIEKEKIYIFTLLMIARRFFQEDVLDDDVVLQRFIDFASAPNVAANFAGQGTKWLSYATRAKDIF